MTVSEVQRYNCATVQGLPCMMPRQNGVWVQSVDYDAAQSELSALRGELARKDVVIEDMVESNCDMGQFLAAAEQRNAVMTELLIACRLEFSTSEANAWEIAMREKIDAALKPTESGASE